MIRVFAFLLCLIPAIAFGDAGFIEEVGGVAGGSAGCSGDYGYTTEGGSSTSFIAFELRVSQVVLECAGTIENIKGYTSGFSSESNEAIAVLYAGDAGSNGGDAGEPYTLLYNSAAFYDAGNTTVSLLVDSSVSEVVPAGTYWVGFFAETNKTFTYDSASGQNRKTIVGAFSAGDVPNPWPHASDTHSTAGIPFYVNF